MLEHSFFMFLLANMFLLKLLLFAGFQWGTSRGVKKRQGKAWYAWSFEHFDGFAVGTFGTFLMAQRQSQRQSQRAVPPLGVAWSGPFPTANWIENCGPLGTCAKKSKHFDLMRQVSPTAGPLDVEWWTHMIFLGIWDSNEGRRLTEFLDRSTRGLVRISEGWEVSQYQEPMERWLASEDRCYAIALCPLLQTSVKCVCKYMETCSNSWFHHQDILWRCSFVQEFTCRCMQLLLAARSLKMFIYRCPCGLLQSLFGLSDFLVQVLPRQGRHGQRQMLTSECIKSQECEMPWPGFTSYCRTCPTYLQYNIQIYSLTWTWNFSQPFWNLFPCLLGFEMPRVLL